MLSHRVGGLAGLGFLVLVGSANIILGVAGQPSPGASPAEVNEFFASSGAAVGAASSIATLVWICLALFAGGIVARLRQKAPDRVESWPLVGLGAAFMQNTIFSMVVACQIVLSTADLSSESASALWQLHNALFTLNGTSLALVLLSFSIAGLRAGLIRRWHGTLGLVAAATLALSSFLTPIHIDGGPLILVGLAGFLMWLVWIATYSITLLREDRVAPETVEAAPAPVPMGAPA